MNPVKDTTSDPYSINVGLAGSICGFVWGLAAGVDDSELPTTIIQEWGPLDCRRANLVVRTMAEQVSSPPKLAVRNGRSRTSRYKRVGREKQVRKRCAMIILDGNPGTLAAPMTRPLARRGADMRT